MENVTLLHAPLPADGTWRWQRALLDALPYGKRLELERRDEAGLRASLGGLALLVLGAAQTRPAGLSVSGLAFAPDQKPRCDGGPYFSISHAEGRVACAVSETLDVGVDIERLGSPGPASDLDKLRRWTATEAVLKAAGLGLKHVNEVVLDADLTGATTGRQRCALRQVPIGEGYVCHLASAGAPAVRLCGVRLDDLATSLAIERSLRLAAQVQQALG